MAQQYPINQIYGLPAATPTANSTYNQFYSGAVAGPSTLGGQQNPGVEYTDNVPQQMVQGQPGQGQSQGLYSQEQIGGMSMQSNQFAYPQQSMAMGGQIPYNFLPRGYVDGGAYMTQGQYQQGQYANQNYLSQTNFPASKIIMTPATSMVNQGQCQQAYSTNQDSLIGIQAIKLIRKIWGTPCGVNNVKKTGPQLFSCKQTCGGKEICKPVSCVLTKCPKIKKCAPPFQSTRIDPQPCCPPPCQIPRPRVKCQFRYVSTPRPMLVRQSNDPQNPEPLPVPVPAVSNLGPVQGQEEQVRSSTPVTSGIKCCGALGQCAVAASSTRLTRQFTDLCVGCNTEERYISPTQAQGQPFFERDSRTRFRDPRDFWRDDYYDDPRSRGRGYGPDPSEYRFNCRARSCDNYERECDSCESFERWREKCALRKRLRGEKIDTKDGQNDPKPMDQATISDDKMGKPGKSVSVNTSKTKVKKSKSAGSVKSKGKLKKKDKKGKKGGKNGGKKKK